MEPRARYVVAAAVLLVLIGIAFRLWRLDGSVFSSDEAVASQHVAGYSERDVIAAFSKREGVRAHEAGAYALGGSRRGPRDVVATLAAEDPQHPPLFYVVAHGWRAFFGSSIAASRALSALFGLLGIASAGALCALVTRSAIGGWSGAALFALSPFQVVYAQEVREYSLFATLTLLSSALLIASLRRPAVSMLVAYAVACVAGLYTFTMFLLVLAAHGTILVLRRPGRETVRRLALAMVAAVVCWVPWIAVLVERRDLVASTNDWSGVRWSPLALAAKWLFNGATSFFDLTYLDARWAPVSLMVLFVLALALFALQRAAPDARAVVVSLMLWSFGSLAVIDLAGGGHRSTVARYVVPAFCALTVAVAAWVSAAWSAKRPSLALGSALALCLAGAASLSVRSTHTVWWDNAKEGGIPSIAAAIDSTRLPVLVTNVNWPIMANLARYVRTDPSFVLVDTDRVAGALATKGRAFVVTTSPASRHALEANTTLRPHVVFVSSTTSAPVALFRRHMLAEQRSAQDDAVVDDAGATLFLVGAPPLAHR
jgi:uncharacterized membrane protein